MTNALATSDSTPAASVKYAAKLQCVVLPRDLDKWLTDQAELSGRSKDGQIVAELQRLMSPAK